MARQLRVQYPNAFYHIIQRGIERKDIFVSERDREKFLKYLEFAHIKYGLIIHTYCLMKNHYHLIAETPHANICNAMHFINSSYVTYFNTKRKRNGPLLQGRYKAIIVQDGKYLNQLSSYIHLNPVRIRIVKHPAEYNWSSYKYFLGSVKPPAWLNSDLILSIIDSNKSKARKLYKKIVSEDILKKENSPTANLKRGFILGDEKFVESIKERFLKAKKHPEIPSLNKLNKGPTLEKIKELVAQSLDENKKLQKKIFFYAARKHSGNTLNEIAAFCGNISIKGVSQAFQRTNVERKWNLRLNKAIVRIEKKIVELKCRM